MSSKFKIDIENFQSIGNADITFIPGINLIVGQSNSGKSAIIRAVNSVITNPSRAKHFVKKGTDKATVTVSYADNMVTWTRTPKASTYTINGDPFSKVGGANLFDLLEGGCGFVHDDSNKIMNIEGEWDLPFPFDRTPSELFKLFENIFCVSDSSVILKAYKDEEAELARRKTSTYFAAEKVKTKLQGIKELNEDVNLELITNKQKKLEKHIEEYFTLLEDLQHLEKCTKLAGFTLDEKQPPATYSLNTYEDMLEDYQMLVGVVKKRKFYRTLPDSLILEDLSGKYLELKKDYEVVTEAMALDKLDLSKECAVDGSSLNEYLELIEDINYIEHASKAQSFDLEESYTPNTNLLEAYELLCEDYKFIYNCYKKRKTLKESYMKLEEKIAFLESQLNNFKVCPLCGHALDNKENE